MCGAKSEARNAAMSAISCICTAVQRDVVQDDGSAPTSNPRAAACSAMTRRPRGPSTAPGQNRIHANADLAELHSKHVGQAAPGIFRYRVGAQRHSDPAGDRGHVDDATTAGGAEFMGTAARDV